MRDPLGTNPTVADAMRLIRETSERELAGPLDALVGRLYRSMDEEARAVLPHGEHLPLDLVRALARGLYDYRFENVEEDGCYKLRCVATPRENRRLGIDPEKVVAITDEKGETVGLVVSEGAFWIEEEAGG